MKIIGESLQPDGPFSVTIEVRTREEYHHLKSACRGVRWVKIDPDTLRLTSALAYTIPGPKPDPVVTPHFTGTNQESFIPYTKCTGEYVRDPSGIYAQHVGLFRDYAGDAALLESAGFSCLRSRRDGQGQYWEIWYLPSPRLGRGPLEGMKTAEEIAAWLMSTVRPGEISTEGIHWGLGYD